MQGDTLASAFQSGAIPIRGIVNMDEVNGIIRAAQAVPGASVAARSASTLRATETARSSSSGATQAPRIGKEANLQGRDIIRRSTARPARIPT